MKINGNFTNQELEFILSVSKQSLEINLTLTDVYKQSFLGEIDFTFKETKEKEGFLPEEFVETLSEDDKKTDENK